MTIRDIINNKQKEISVLALVYGIKEMFYKNSKLLTLKVVVT